jgi:BirA family biotin operon repressor/biotin-[acetyl-CoA-carboxylase] ligase
MIETLSSPEGRSFIVIGIGINIMDNSSNEDLSISSLIEYNIHNVNIENIIKDIVINFENYKKIWSKDGFIPIKELWMEHAYNVGSQIYVQNNGVRISAIFTGINDSGSINILLESGLTDSISIGDVFFIK